MLSVQIVQRFSRSGFLKKFISQNNVKNYWTEPIIEGQYQVTPARAVPPQIIRPDYVNNPNPQFGIYHGPPVVHDKQMQLKLKKAGNLAGRALKHVCERVQEGMTTDDVDEIVHNFIIENGAYPTPIGFMYFPKSVCTSVNEVACHGIPNKRPLKNGDYLNIDITLYLDGVHGDNSAMVKIGNVHPEVCRLIDVTQKALYESIKLCGPGVPFNIIGRCCEDIARQNNFHICELFTGHGVGHLLHMPPIVYHHENDEPYVMQPGNVFTIEPIIMLHKKQYQMWNDGMTVVSPGNPSAQWEHMVLITDNGYEVITQREGEIIQ